MALYKAKKNGKNQVFYAGKPEKTVDLDSVTQEEKWSLARSTKWRLSSFSAGPGHTMEQEVWKSGPQERELIMDEHIPVITSVASGKGGVGKTFRNDQPGCLTGEKRKKGPGGRL